MIVHTRADQLLSQLLIEHFDTLPTKCRYIEHIHEGVWSQKSISDKMAAMRPLTFFQTCFNKKGLCLFYDRTIRADQLLPQLLMELFDTLYTQC